MFEALFDRRLKPDGAFARALADAGYQPSTARPTYPTAVWVRCLEVAREHRFADLPRAEAYRRIGREFSEGFLETLSGKLLGVALGFMTPARYVRRLATYFRLGRDDDDLTMELVRDEPGAIDAEVHNPAAVPGGFVAGMIDAAFARFGVTWTIDVEQRTETDYRRRIRWTAPAG